MNKDWTGNSNSIYKTLGASNHTDKHRQQQDYYATEPKAVELLLEVEHKNIGVTWIEALIICIVVYLAQSEPLSQNSK